MRLKCWGWSNIDGERTLGGRYEALIEALPDGIMWREKGHGEFALTSRK